LHPRACLGLRFRNHFAPAPGSSPPVGDLVRYSYNARLEPDFGSSVVNFMGQAYAPKEEYMNDESISNGKWTIRILTKRQ